VAVANAILLITFAENARQTGLDAAEAARKGASERLRPILMTSCAMIAGMVPMALGLGEGGEQSAPLGRAVIGGLGFATAATLLILPAVFAVVMGRTRIGSASLHPGDPESPLYLPRTEGPQAHAPAASHSQPPVGQTFLSADPQGRQECLPGDPAGEPPSTSVTPQTNPPDPPRGATE
jgi:hypothetical protein